MCVHLADYIVIADQQSTDGSREVARRFEKVVLVDNPHEAYDEGARQRLLIDSARQLPVSGKRILIALDADEMFSANWMESPEWQQLLAAPPGTVLYFRWANIGPDVACAWWMRITSPSVCGRRFAARRAAHPQPPRADPERCPGAVLRRDQSTALPVRRLESHA